METPGTLYAFWFLNHRLEDGEMKRQLRVLKDAGFSGIFPHPRAGLLTPYLSRTWFDRVRTIARECRRLGLEFWLYDEDPYPSGVCGGKVTFDHEEFASRSLRFSEHEAAGDGDPVEVRLPPGELLYAGALRLSGPATPEGGPDADSYYARILRGSELLDLTPDCGPVRTTWAPARRGTSGYYPPYVHRGREHWRTAAHTTYWMLRTELPPGRWLVVAAYCQRGTNAKWGAYVDCMNPRATSTFLRLTHDRYRKELGEELFATVPGIFTDEAKVEGDFPWTKALPDHYRRHHGHSLLPLLPHLRYEIDDRTPVVRQRYRRLVGRLFRDSFVRPIHDWCRRNGIRSTGHFSPEEDPIGQQRMVPDLMELLGDMQLPGVDLISSNIGTREFPIINIGPKLVASVARQQGRPQLLSESLGVSGEDLNPARMKSMLDWQMVLGVNKFVLHGQFYSLDGPRKREAPPSIFETAPYWPCFGKLVAHVDRCCAVLREGERLCRLAVLYPTTNINVLLPSHSRLEQLRQHMGDLCFQLLAQGFDFDFVSEQAVGRARDAGGKLGVGRCTYDLLVVPHVDLVDDAALAQLEATSVPIVLVESRPKGLETGAELTRGDICTLADLVDTLADRIERPLSASPGGGLFVHSRAQGGGRLHFVYNIGEVEATGELTTSTGRWLEALDEQTGEYVALPSGSGDGPGLRLPALGSALLRECDARGGPAAGWQTVAVPGPWRVRPAGPNTLVLDEWEFDSDTVRLPQEAEVLRSPGEVRLKATFHVTDVPQDARLVWERGTFARSCSIQLNGHRVPEPAAERVYDVHNLVADVHDLLQPGPNRVEIVIAPGEADAPACIDPLRLMGEFALGRRDYAWDVLAPDLPLAVSGTLDWAENGWPFYSGSMTAEADLILEDAPETATRLRVHGLSDVARVTVNGSEADIVAWPPYDCCVGHLLRTGTNRLRLDVANSFVNFIEGTPRRSGFTGVEVVVPGPPR